MKDLILSLSIFTSTIFFSISTILGQNPEDTSGYHLFAAGYAVVCVFVLWIESQRYRKRMKVSNILSLFVLFVIVTIGLFSDSTNNTYFQQYIVFSIPAALVGMYYGSKQDVSLLIKWLDVYFIIITISVFVSFPQYYSSRLFGEELYSQKLSYESAFVLLLNVFLLADTNRSRHFNFTNTKLYRAFAIIIIPLLLFIIILSGGRGGFLTLLFGFIVFLYANKRKRRHVFRYIIVVTAIIFVAYLVAMQTLDPTVYDFASESFGRIFSYISDGKIDMSQTSGRDEILTKAFSLIKSKPILGYGFFNYINSLGTYPHNIFVEWLLQGGILFFVFSVCLTLRFYIKILNMIKHDNSFVVILPIFIYPLTELLFSGTWVSNPFLWFSLFYVWNYQGNNCAKVPVSIGIDEKELIC